MAVLMPEAEQCSYKDIFALGFKSITWVLPVCMSLLFPRVTLFCRIDLFTPFAINTSRLRKKLVMQFSG